MKFEKPSVTVDVAVCTIKDNDLKVLLIKRSKNSEAFPNYWAIPGGFVDIPKKESLEKTAERELKEETNLENIYIEQLKTYGNPGRDPRELYKNGVRVITVAYFALVPYNKILEQNIVANDDAIDTSWFSFKNLPKNLAFDHREILNDLLNRLIGKITYTPIAFQLIPKQFTWNELQNVYEIILSKRMFAYTFRRKINSMYVIKQIDKKKNKFGRPSIILEFVRKKEFMNE